MAPQSGEDIVGCTLSDTYTVQEYDLVSHFARRFPRDTFESPDVVATAILFLWGERLCLIALGSAVGHEVKMVGVNHEAAVTLGVEVKVTVECVRWYGRMTDWTFQATVADRPVAHGTIVMCSVNPRVFARWQSAGRPVPTSEEKRLQGETAAELEWLRSVSDG